MVHGFHFFVDTYCGPHGSAGASRCVSQLGLRTVFIRSTTSTVEACEDAALPRACLQTLSNYISVSRGRVNVSLVINFTLELAVFN